MSLKTIIGHITKSENKSDGKTMLSAVGVGVRCKPPKEVRGIASQNLSFKNHSITDFDAILTEF